MSRGDEKPPTPNPYLTGGPFRTANGFEFSETDHRCVRGAAVLNIASQLWLEMTAHLPAGDKIARYEAAMRVLQAIPEIDTALRKVAEPKADDDGELF